MVLTKLTAGGRVLRLLALAASVASLDGCGGIKTIQSAALQRQENEVAEDREFKLDPHLAIVSAAPRKLGVNGPAPIANTYKGSSNADPEPPKDTHQDFILAANDSQTLIHEFGLMAAFSTMVYYRHVPTSKRYARKPDQTSGATQDACSLNQVEHPLPALMKKTGLLTLSAVGELIRGQWELWRPGDPIACVSDDDLFYETYAFRRASDETITDAVIVFRGTENTPGQLASDWKDNFSAAIGVEPHQYKLAREKLKQTLAALSEVNRTKQGPMPRVYATGHSLGGGLAQMAVYTNKEILAAYAFNTSPVTDWSYLKPLKLVEVTDPVIYRIHQRGEFLGNLREVTSRVNARRFGRSDYEFNYQEKGGEVAKHSISLLACNFAGFIANQDGAKAPFAFGYDKAFAAKLFRHNLDRTENKQDQAEDSGADQEALCKPAIREKVCAAPPASASEICRY